MASPVPAKSQPLHNFNLPQLKWNKDGHSGGHNHHRRRSIKSPSRRPNSSSASPLRRSTSRDSVSATPPRLQSPLRDSAAALSSPIRGESFKNSSIRGGGESKKHSAISRDSGRNFQRRDLALESEALSKSKDASIGHERNNNNNNNNSRSSAFYSISSRVYSTNPEQAKNKIEKKLKGKEINAVAETKRSKILIKLPCKNNNNNKKLEEENPQPRPLKIKNNDDHNEVQEEDKKNNSNINFDEDAKIWNLRPRKPLRKSQNVTGGAEKSKAPAMPEKNKSQSPPMTVNKSGEKEGSSGIGTGGGGGGGGEKKQKRKLSISVALTKQEIEEDIYALTGSKPARRPKKRARNVQKQVDAVFPGLWLVSITPDSYKVSENSMKG